MVNKRLSDRLRTMQTSLPTAPWPAIYPHKHVILVRVAPAFKKVEEHVLGAIINVKVACIASDGGVTKFGRRLLDAQPI